MDLNVRALTEQHCKEICSWYYPAPYELYNWPAWGTMVAQEIQFADPDIRQAQFAAVVRLQDEAGTESKSEIAKKYAEELIGYVQYFPMHEVTRLGLGVRPDLCDKGFGVHFMQAILKEAHLRNPTHEIDLEVHTWNVRAQKTYAKAGFVKTDEYERMTLTGVGQFYCMVYEEKKADSQH